MAPLPKRKHSTKRKGKRLATRNKQLPRLVECHNCHKQKVAHRVCKYCGK